MSEPQKKPWLGDEKPPSEWTPEERNFNFTPTQYLDMLRLFEEAQTLFPLDGTKKRAEWHVQACAIKVPVPFACPVCNHPFAFVISPVDQSVGYCSVEEKTHRVERDDQFVIRVTST